MANLNVAMLLGNLVKDPELRYTQQGIPVTNFTVAVNQKVKSAEGQESKKTLFMDVTAWRRLAEICAQFLKKGRQVIVVGQLEQQKWQDENGRKRVKTVLIAQTVQFIGGKSADNEDGPAEDEAEVA